MRAVKSEFYTLTQIYDRDFGWCGICGEAVDPSLRYPDPKSASVDHIKPLNKGGEDTRNNVQLAHLGCNAAKGDKYVEEA